MFDKIMILTVASFKGGVGKTTSAVHLAALLAEQGKTLLVDGDPNRSASGWARRGLSDGSSQSVPFTVVDERAAARHVRTHDHIVIDTQARPAREDLEALADGCDLLILPSTPDALALDALLMTVDELRGLEKAGQGGATAFRILLTMIPPRPSRDGEEALATLRGAGLPVFDTLIGRRVAFQKAALAGVTVQEAPDPRAAQAWENYRQVGAEIFSLLGTTSGESR